MWTYVLRRVLQAIPTILGVLFILFALFFMVSSPQKIAQRILGEKATEEQVEQWVADHGYDKPLFWNSDPDPGTIAVTDTIFWNYMSDMLTFQFGASDLDDVPIGDKLKAGVGPSLTLTVPVFFVGLVFSIATALVVSLFRGTYIDTMTTFLCVVGMSVVFFLYIIGGQFIFGRLLRWFPISGFSMGHLVHFLMLPVVVGVIAGVSEQIRFYRTVMLNEAARDYIRTARAKGLKYRTILRKHLLKNAMIPVLTNVVMRIPMLFLGALLTESFFGIPGLGRLLFESITNNDFRTMAALVYISSLLYIFANIITDISYTWVDPRVRLS